MKAFFHPVYVIHYLEACTAGYRAIKVKTIIYSIEGATNQTMHMLPKINVTSENNIKSQSNR
jgi:hypothetical protein